MRVDFWLFFKKFCEDTKRSFTPTDASQRQLLRRYGITEAKSSDGLARTFRRYPRRVDKDGERDRDLSCVPPKGNTYLLGVDVITAVGQPGGHYAMTDMYEYSRPYLAEMELAKRNGKPIIDVMEMVGVHNEKQWSFDRYMDMFGSFVNFRRGTQTYGGSCDELIATVRGGYASAAKFAAKTFSQYRNIAGCKSDFSGGADDDHEHSLGVHDKELFDEHMTALSNLFTQEALTDVPHR